MGNAFSSLFCSTDGASHQDRTRDAQRPLLPAKPAGPVRRSLAEERLRRFILTDGPYAPVNGSQLEANGQPTLQNFAASVPPSIDGASAASYTGFLSDLSSAVDACAVDGDAGGDDAAPRVRRGPTQPMPIPGREAVSPADGPQRSERGSPVEVAAMGSHFSDDSSDEEASIESLSEEEIFTFDFEGFHECPRESAAAKYMYNFISGVTFARSVQYIADVDSD